MLNTNEENKKRFDHLEAFALYISTLKGSGENLKDGAFLRGNRGFFWRALDAHFGLGDRNPTEVIQQQIMENQILLFNLDCELNKDDARSDPARPVPGPLESPNSKSTATASENCEF